MYLERYTSPILFLNIHTILITIKYSNYNMQYFVSLSLTLSSISAVTSMTSHKFHSGSSPKAVMMQLWTCSGVVGFRNDSKKRAQYYDLLIVCHYALSNHNWIYTVFRSILVLNHFLYFALYSFSIYNGCIQISEALAF